MTQNVWKFGNQTLIRASKGHQPDEHSVMNELNLVLDSYETAKKKRKEKQKEVK